MRKFISSLAGAAILFSSLTTNLYAGNKFNLPNFEKMTPSIEVRRAQDIDSKITRIRLDKFPQVLYRVFDEGYVVVSIDCKYRGKAKRVEMFIRDRKQNKAFQRENYSTFRRLKEVPYETLIDWGKIYCPDGQHLVDGLAENRTRFS